MPTCKVFISYSHEDETWAIELHRQLRLLEKSHECSVWIDQQSTRTGTDWESAMRSALESSQLVLLLISDHFFASEWCYQETQAALDRRQNAKTVVIPIILKQVNWWRFMTVSSLQALPKNARPIKDPTGDNPDSWPETIKGITDEIDKINSGGVPFPSGFDNVLKPYPSITPQIRNRLAHARSFWLLSRTSSGWWRDFGELFEQLAKGQHSKKPVSRVLALDPASKAFKNTAKDFRPWEEKHGKTFARYRSDAKKHITQIEAQPSVDVRLLDRVVPHVILFVDPPASPLPPKSIGDWAVAYYLLPSWDTNDYRYQDKYVIEVPAQEHHHFMTLYKLFENLWESVQTSM